MFLWNFSIGIIPEDIQLFHLMYRTSSQGRRDLAEQLLLDKDEFKISSSYTSRVAEIFSVILKSLGLKLEFIDEDEQVQEYDDSYISLHTLEDKEYLCTDYQFMLVKRKHNIEKELLNKYGVIDADELEKLVMIELMNRNFVIGPDKDEIETVEGYKPDTVK